MKKKIYIILPLLILTALLISYMSKPKYKLAFYRIKNITSSRPAINTPLDKLVLEDKPILTEKDILAYYWRSNIFVIKESVLEDKFQIPGVGDPPFVLTVNGERIYLGAFSVRSISSFGPPEGMHRVAEPGYQSALNELHKDGYSVDFPFPRDKVYLEILAPSKGEDKRNDPKIKAAIKAAGILKD